MTVKRLIFLGLFVADIEKSARFYRDAFGLDLSISENPGGDPWVGGMHAETSWREGRISISPSFRQKISHLVRTSLSLSTTWTRLMSKPPRQGQRCCMSLARKPGDGPVATSIWTATSSP